MTKDFDNLIQVYETFPFLESFPFEEYNIRIEKERDFGVELDPKNKILYEGDLELELEPVQHLIHFTYRCDNSDVTISFYLDDIDFLNDRADKIIKLDSIRKIIDVGLNNIDIVLKMKAIKKLGTFMKKVGTTDVLKKDAFGSVLKSIQSMSGMKIPRKISTRVINLDEKINIKELKVDEEKCIMLYLDFQLHHAKIILGTIIASKIY